MPFCVECDGCRKHAPTSGRGTQAPKDWIVVLCNGTMRTYCSKACYDLDEKQREWRARADVVPRMMR